MANIQLPPDSTGKKARTSVSAVAPTDEHIQHFIIANANGDFTALVDSAGKLLVSSPPRARALGVATTRNVVGAGADTATGGRLWLLNPVDSTVRIAIRRIDFASAPTAATAFVTSPRVTVERITFTGTASGTVVVPTVRDTSDPALVGTLRSTNGGITITAGPVAYAFLVVPILTAAGASVPTEMQYLPVEEARIVLRPGQGIVIRQADAGSSSDTRSFVVNIGWEEF